MLEALIVILIVVAVVGIAKLSMLSTQLSHLASLVEATAARATHIADEQAALRNLVKEGGQPLLELVASVARSATAIENVAREVDRYLLPSHDERRRIRTEAWPFKMPSGESPSE